MRKKKKSFSLFTKYFTAFSAIILICFAIVGAGLTAFVSNYWKNEKENLLLENAKNLSSVTGEFIRSDNFDVQRSKIIIANSLELISESVDADFFVCGYDSQGNGKVTICRHMASAANLNGNFYCKQHSSYTIPKDIMAAASSSDGYISMGKLGGVYNKNFYIVGEPIIVNGNSVGAVFATTPASGLSTYVYDILKMFWLSALFALLLSFLVIYALTYNLIKPLRMMSEATKSFAKGDFSYRVKVTSDDELGELAKAFNSMALALSTLESSRRSFVANVSHELKTPMTTIGGFIDGILDGTIPKDKQDHYLRIVSDEVKRLTRLIFAMLNMSKIEAGELELKPQQFDVSELIFHVLVSFEQAIEKKNIEIRGLDSLQSIVIEADPDMIHQVIYNLIDNAVKFTNVGGYISVSVISDEKKVLVNIRNSGPGIPSEELSKIFERFYKVDRSRSIDVKGTGLGLYIVKSIIELHGGQISVQSELNEYSEFTFWIPLKYGNNK